MAPPLPRLHLVTDDAVLARRDFTDLARRLLAAGADRVALHVRGPGTGGGRVHALTAALVATARETGALLVVNDRVDVALAVGTEAVHLAGRSLPVVEARRILGPGARVGVSAHGVGEVAGAVAEGADWTFVGTIYPTPSHPDRRGSGPQGVRTAVAAAGHAPVLAIGGVTPPRVAEVRAAGAWGVAVVRGVWDATDPAEAVGEYLAECYTPRSAQAPARGAAGAEDR